MVFGPLHQRIAHQTSRLSLKYRILFGLCISGNEPLPLAQIVPRVLFVGSSSRRLGWIIASSTMLSRSVASV